mmetsp:Transcript_46183/g.100347  ORF Transcript_46183/g.100347 Transcript_46183/m.100347 type:complete len:313 (-) Transcript_46183:226-1164(-)
MPFFGMGRGGSPLEAELRQITENQALETPPADVLLSIIQASQGSDERREIMHHLKGCLSESSPGRWRRIYGGLVLMDHLLQRGSPLLVTETAEGHHFDIVQRLTFLEAFEFSTDKRVQGMMRQKATALRSELIARLQSAEVEDNLPSKGSSQNQASAKHVTSDNTYSASSSWSTAAPVGPPQPFHRGKNVIGGVVAVGHRDDTTSESSADEENRPAPKATTANGSSHKASGARRERRNERRDLEERRRHVLDESTDSESSSDRERRSRQRASRAAKESAEAGAGSQRGASKEAPTKAPAPPPPAADVDLLGL